MIWLAWDCMNVYVTYNHPAKPFLYNSIIDHHWYVPIVDTKTPSFFLRLWHNRMKLVNDMYSNSKIGFHTWSRTANTCKTYFQIRMKSCIRLIVLLSAYQVKSIFVLITFYKYSNIFVFTFSYMMFFLLSVTS